MKTSGLGDDLFFGGYHLGGDIQQLSLSGSMALLDVTDITQSAHSRLGGLRDGTVELTAYMDPADGAEHAAFSPLTLADVIVTYCRGQLAGNPSVCQVSKQLNYDPTRANDGMLTEKVTCDGNGFGQEWGLQLTDGLRTDPAGTDGPAVDNTTPTTFGAQAYLQAVSLTGTTATVTVQQSADNTTWSTLAAFDAVTSAPQAQRIAVTGTVDRYLRVITAGTFTSFGFQCTVVRNTVETVF